MKKTYILFIFTFIYFCLGAQDLKFANYPFFRDGINPSSFIQANDINALFLYSNEFSGFETKPMTQVADVSFNLQGHKLGLTFANDKIGYNRKQNITLRFAKRFYLSENSFFSLGLGAGVISNVYETTRMVFEEEGDPLSMYDHTQTAFDFDFGAEFQFNNLFVGISSKHLNRAFSNPDNESPIAHYYGYAQYSFNTQSLFSFYPVVLMRSWKNIFWGEAGMMTFYKNSVWLGIMYSSDHDLTVPFGMRIFKNIMFGYAFKSNMNPNLSQSWKTNSNEVFLNISINKNDITINTPRFMD